jgi:hypothetical protein
MKNKKGFSVFILVFLLCLFQLALAYADYAHIVNKDTHGALSREGMDEMNKALLAQDHIAFNKLITRGEIFAVKKGTRVFLEDLSFLEGYAKVRPEGETRSIWMFTAYLTPESEAKDIKRQKSTPADEKSSACRIQGFFLDNHRPAIMIGEEVYSFGDSVCGGQILNITTDRVRIKFPNDLEKMYKAGDVIK